MPAQYLTSAARFDQLPHYSLPELALIGRSNVGKSTLINQLTQTRGLARTSRTPGRTQMINFFSLDQGMIIADLPGYGYNEARAEVQTLWEPLINEYLKRPNIRDFIFLCDIRREIREEDLAFMALLGANLPLVLVLTKADKLSRAQALRQEKAYAKRLSELQIPLKAVLAVSSLKKTGLSELKTLLELH